MFDIEEGKRVGALSRTLHPAGKLIDEPTLVDAVKQTAELLRSPGPLILFEAAFLADGYAARADILIREGGGRPIYRLVEVKSALGVKSEYIGDAAYTAAVIERSGVPLDRIEVVHLSADWRLGMPTEKLFVTVDCTQDVRAEMEELAVEFASITDSTFRADRPEPVLTTACKECEYFSSECLGKEVTASILTIPRISSKLLSQLDTMGVRSIHEIPATVKLTPNQALYTAAVRENRTVIETEALDGIVKQISWPAFYLDFETVKSPIPFWPGIAPHEQVLTQYSLHICDHPGEVREHRSYLGDHTKDCRRELAEQLVEDLGTSGSIVVYSTFEEQRLRALAALFPDLTDRIDACIERLFDLAVIFSQCVSHPDFAGRVSIKKTLPALVPSLSYDHLEIRDGNTAVAMFLRLARGECDAGEVQRIRGDLAKYCELDTLAMVKLHEAVLRMSSIHGS